MTTKLTELLRRIAEKEPEKFNIGGDYFWVGDDWGLRLDRLDQSHIFSLDHMDAIAGALGMEFVVTLEEPRVSTEWYFYIYDQNSDIVESIPCPKGFDSKRSASIAALCAILEYKLEEK